MKNNIAVCLHRLITSIGGLTLFLFGSPANAQHFSLSREQLKVYEGVFQSPKNADMSVRFVADSGSLLATRSWEGGPIRLNPESAADFYTADQDRIHIKFIKGEKDQFVQISINDNEVWNRVKNFQSLIRNEIPHTVGQLKPFEGLFQYEGDKNRYVQVLSRDNQLILKFLADGQEVPFVPDSNWDFFNKERLVFTLHFVKGPDSAIQKVVVAKNNVWNKVSAVAYTPAQLKVFEGKYKLKDDPDDIIQIRAAGSNLVVIQLWDRKETILYPMAADYFYNASLAYPAKFLKDDNGAVTMVLLLTGDLFEKIRE